MKITHSIFQKGTDIMKIHNKNLPFIDRSKSIMELKIFLDNAISSKCNNKNIVNGSPIGIVRSDESGDEVYEYYKKEKD